MARMSLSLNTLKDFDAGKAHAAFQQALKQVVQDILDRPGDKTAREVVLTLVCTPVILQDGDVIDAEIYFRVKSKIPAWQTASKPLAVTKGGQLVFSELAPDNPHQMTLDEEFGD